MAKQANDSDKLLLDDDLSDAGSLDDDEEDKLLGLSPVSRNAPSSVGDSSTAGKSSISVSNKPSVSTGNKISNSVAGKSTISVSNKPSVSTGNKISNSVAGKSTIIVGNKTSSSISNKTPISIENKSASSISSKSSDSLGSKSFSSGGNKSSIDKTSVKTSIVDEADDDVLDIGLTEADKFLDELTETDVSSHSNTPVKVPVKAINSKDGSTKKLPTAKVTGEVKRLPSPIIIQNQSQPKNGRMVNQRNQRNNQMFNGQRGRYGHRRNNNNMQAQNQMDYNTYHQGPNPGNQFQHNSPPMDSHPPPMMNHIPPPQHQQQLGSPPQPPPMHPQQQHQQVEPMDISNTQPPPQRIYVNPRFQPNPAVFPPFPKAYDGNPNYGPPLQPPQQQQQQPYQQMSGYPPQQPPYQPPPTHHYPPPPPQQQYYPPPQQQQHDHYNQMPTHIINQPPPNHMPPVQQTYVQQPPPFNQLPPTSLPPSYTPNPGSSPHSPAHSSTHSITKGFEEYLNFKKNFKRKDSWDDRTAGSANYKKPKVELSCNLHIIKTVQYDTGSPRNEYSKDSQSSSSGKNSGDKSFTSIKKSAHSANQNKKNLTQNKKANEEKVDPEEDEYMKKIREQEQKRREIQLKKSRSRQLAAQKSKGGAEEKETPKVIEPISDPKPTVPQQKSGLPTPQVSKVITAIPEIDASIVNSVIHKESHLKQPQIQPIAPIHQPQQQHRPRPQQQQHNAPFMQQAPPFPPGNRGGGFHRGNMRRFHGPNNNNRFHAPTERFGTPNNERFRQPTERFVSPVEHGNPQRQHFNNRGRGRGGQLRNMENSKPNITTQNNQRPPFRSGFSRCLITLNETNNSTEILTKVTEVIPVPPCPIVEQKPLLTKTKVLIENIALGTTLAQVRTLCNEYGPHEIKMNSSERKAMVNFKSPIVAAKFIDECQRKMLNLSYIHVSYDDK